MRKGNKNQVNFHEYHTTSEYDIQKRIAKGIPLTKKQKRAVKNRKVQQPVRGMSSYKRNRSRECEVKVDPTGHSYILPKGA